MKKLLPAFVLTFFFFIFCSAQEQYSRIKIFADHEDLQILASSGLPIDHGIFRAGVYVICELSATEIAIVEAAGIRYEIMIPDVSRFYEEQNAPFIDRLDEVKSMQYSLSREWPVPEGFELGPVGGFLTIDQAMEHLDSMASQYPELISPRYTLDYQSHNGQDVFWVRLSDNPNINEDEPEILYTGMIHAREAIGMQLLLFYMYYLLENYDTDPDVQYIVNNFELYFVPIVNVDGYAYNILTNPLGGGNWRKNRRINGDGSFGVDLNRNFGYYWGYNNTGSSPTPSDATYRGPFAFSEPETQALRNFCESHEFRIALNYHSYANLLLYPWGWSDIPCPHNDVFNAHGEILTRENDYEYGPGNTTIYATNGGSDDWMYGEQETKNLIYSYTPEVGDGSAGFWPPVPMIIPLCQENMWQNLMAARLAGPYAIAKDLSPLILESSSGHLLFEIKRLGLDDGATYTVSIEPLNDALASVSPPIEFSGLEILETVSEAFAYTLKEDIQSGQEVRYLLSVNNGFATFSDTISKIYGTPVVIFSDSVSTFSNWTSSKWNVTNSQYHSPDKSITDSPFGQYSNNENNSIVIKDPIDLGYAAFAVLNFWAKWDIESGYDYVQVFVSSNNGLNWVPMEGKYTRTGGSNQALGQPLYDGTQLTWVREEINLQEFLGDQIKIRFLLKSDNYVVGDGFYWDDLTVTIIDITTGMSGEIKPGLSGSAIFSPNPASGNVSLSYSLSKDGGDSQLMIYNSNGQQVHQAWLENSEGVLNIDIKSWKPGLYFYSVHSAKSVVASGKLVVYH